jgi:hypothetical protein
MQVQASKLKCFKVPDNVMRIDFLAVDKHHPIEYEDLEPQDLGADQLIRKAN